MEGPRFPPGRTRGGSLGFSDGGCVDIRASGANVRNRETGDPETIPIRQRFHGISSRGRHGPSPRPFLPDPPQGYVALISDPGWLAPRENFRPVSLARSLLPVDGRIRTVGRTPRFGVRRTDLGKATGAATRGRRVPQVTSLPRTPWPGARSLRWSRVPGGRSHGHPGRKG